MNKKQLLLTSITVGLVFAYNVDKAEASSLLKYGSNNQEVKEIQMDLQKLGYYIKHKPSTYYNYKTKQAVMSFQKDNGLVVDGVVGPNTRKALLQKLSTVNNSEKIEYKRVLYFGYKGSDVKQLQTDLLKLGYSMNRLPNTYYDNQTKDVVMDFQKDNGLVVDGIFGPNSKKTLLSKLSKINNKVDVSKDEKPTTSVENKEQLNKIVYSRLLKVGSRGYSVKMLQSTLNDLGYNVGIEDGVFGNKTKEGVVRLQKEYNLTIDGLVGRNTVNKINYLIDEHNKNNSMTKEVVDNENPQDAIEEEHTNIEEQVSNNPSESELVEETEVVNEETQEQGILTAYKFSGKGWGHSVGMTQYGAKGMAEQGFIYKDILNYYYTDIELEIQETQNTSIRVALNLDVSNTSVSSTDEYTLLDKATGDILLKVPSGVITDISVSNGSLVLHNTISTVKTSNDVQLLTDGLIRYKNNKYEGVLDISMSSKNNIDVINSVHLEKYLRGVVPYEISYSWPMESIKAQTVAARTYALKRVNPTKKFDVYDTVQSQVYKGVNFTHEKIDNAIMETDGVVITHNDRLIDALYSASAGGHTIDSGDIWNDVPYLKGKPDPYDTSRYSQEWWSYEVSLIDMSKVFTEVGVVQSIEVVEYKNERASKVKIVGDKSEITVSGYTFRSRLGYNNMKSAMFIFSEVKE